MRHPRRHHPALVSPTLVAGAVGEGNPTRNSGGTVDNPPRSSNTCPEMSYQVIARKYRPQRFADVVGQEHVTQTLAHAIERNRIAHAYIFCGPRGTGKTTVARIFAKCLNCTDGPRVDFKDDDPRCIEITEGRSLDVLEIDGASNNGVEQVRELRESARFAPAASRFKIYIIDEVHMLSTSAFNALLKTLEEPPPHVKFMFATTDPEKVIPTILSRCQRFDLRRIPVRLIVSHLKSIAANEGVEIEEAALHAIARGADGGMRDAESALDQLISFCGQKIVESDVLAMFGLASQNQVMGLCGAILRGDVPGALKELDELCKHGKDLARLLSDALGHFRNLLIYKVSKGDLSLLEASEAEIACLQEAASHTDTSALTRIMEVLTDSEAQLRLAGSKKIFTEVALVRAIEAREAMSLDVVLRELKHLREGQGPPTAAEPARAFPVASEESPPATPPPKQTQSPPPLALEDQPAPDRCPPSGDPSLDGLWRQLLEAVGRASPFTRSYLVEAFPVSLSDRLLTIGFDPQFADHLTLVDNSKNHSLIATKLSELGRPGLQVKFVVAEAPPPRTSLPAAPPKPTPAANETQESGKPSAAPGKPKTASLKPYDPKEFKGDPKIEEAVRIFQARIVGVKT